MKKSILVLGFLLVSLTTFAQTQLDEKSIQLNLQAGTISTGLVYVGADYGLTDRWSVGGEASFRRTIDVNGFRIAGVGNYRVNNHDKFGVYLGALLGYDIYGTKKHETILGTLEIEGPSGFVIGGHLGLRYFFTDKFGAFFQVGAGNFFEGRIGITYKL